MATYDTPNSLLRNDLILKGNQRLVLVHPSEGYMPLRVISRRLRKHVFDRILTVAGVTSIGANSTQAAIQLFDAINRDEFEVTRGNHLDHLFVGISPPSLKIYPEFPLGTIQRVPDNQNFSPTARFGYVDGWMSPYDDPSPDGEIIIPPGRNLTGWRFHNPTTLAIINPLLNFIGYTYRITVLRNADLVQAVLDERPGFAAAKKELGGMSGYPFDARLVWDADWIPFDYDRAKIEKSLARERKGGE